MGIGSGQFTSGFDERGRKFLASLYGAPFFALSNLAPEVLDVSENKLLLIGSNSMLASDAGRWLSLYAKVLKSAGKVSLSVCVPTKPRTMKPPKPLLFQPIQSVVVKDWQKHLDSLGAPPDVLLYYPDSFDEIQLAACQFARDAVGSNVLISCSTHVFSLSARRLLKLYGYDVGSIVNFGLSEGIPQHHAYGAWWFSARISPNQDLAEVEPNVIDDIKLASELMELFLRDAGSIANREQLAEVYATRATATVAGEVIQAVRISGIDGIDLASGRRFEAIEKSSGTEYSWHGVTLPADLMQQVPKADSSVPIDDDRLALSIWFGQVFSESFKRTQNELSNSGVPAQAEMQEDELESTDHSAAALFLPPIPAPDDHIVDRSEVPGGKAVHARTVTQVASRPRLSRGAGTINVLALAAQLGRIGQDQTDCFANAQGKLLSWLGNKGFGKLDPSCNQHRERPEGEVTIETDGEHTWSVRFDDRRSMESGAIWRVEATLLAHPVQAISLRLLQVRRSEDAPPPVASGVPHVVASIAKDVGLQDAGVPLQESALGFKGESDGPRLSRLLLNPHRAQPIIVISGPTDASADRLAKRLVGVAHVAIIDNAVSNYLVRVFGRDLSVYGSAVRLYRPGFNTGENQYQHRVWPRKGLQLSKWIADDIFEEACTISIDGQDLDDRAPSFAAVRSHLAAARLASTEKRLSDLRKQAESIASSKDEQIMQLQSIRTELESALEEYKFKANELIAEKASLQEELQAVRMERDSALEEIRQLRYKYNNQWEELAAPVSIDNEPGYYPDSWDDLETWVDLYGENKLVLHEKAAKAARASSFRDITLAYKAMDYLVRYYIPMRTRSEGDVDARSRSLQALAELGLEESDVGTADDIKRYKKEYERMYNGKIVTLDRHLKRGVGFGGEYQFRLYFYYDREQAKVLIGHLPSHLTNRLSHNG